MNYEVLNAFSIVFMVLMVLCSIAMIVIVAIQDGGNANLGAVSGSSESFFGKNKVKTMDAKLKRLTMFIGLGILVSSVVYFVLYVLKNNIE